MSNKVTLFFFILLVLFCGGALWGALFYLHHYSVPVLEPKGIIAAKEYDLLIISSCLMLIVVLPAIIFTYLFTFLYREGRVKKDYKPKWDESVPAETVWWGIPFIIIAILAVLDWKYCKELEPSRPLDPQAKSLVVQVVALPWKWLFLYPEYGIATVNFAQVPALLPVTFEITADAPMNSFWVPALAGQIYAMPGMLSKLNLRADVPGEYFGSSANLSGEGFADMAFKIKASSEVEFTDWVNSIKKSQKTLDIEAYKQLREPGVTEASVLYVLPPKDLFSQIIMMYSMSRKI